MLLCCELSMDQVRWFFRQTNLANNTPQLSFFLPLDSLSIDKASAYHYGSVEENLKRFLVIHSNLLISISTCHDVSTFVIVTFHFAVNHVYWKQKKKLLSLEA